MPTYFDGKLVFIHIPKCAGKSVRSALKEYQLRLRPETHGDPLVYRWHESLSEVQGLFNEKWNEEKFEQATVVATIRHPVERAVSYWRYLKKINMMSFLDHKKNPHFVYRLSAAGVVCPCFTPKDYATHHHKAIGCGHRMRRKYVEEFDALTFHDYTKRMTVWKKSGCSYPNCPYHALAPQIRWLHDANGYVKMNKLNLFLVDRLDELQRFLPEMGKIDRIDAYFEKKENEDHRECLTTESLLLLNEFYAEDFKLYEMLKSRPANYYEQLLRP